MAFKVDDLVRDVQEFLQDHPQLNVLIRKNEFGPALIKIAIRMMVDHFNQINWRSTFTAASFPENTFNIQMYGTVFHLMNSASALQTRNHLPYSSGGTSIAQFAKSGEYQALAQKFGDEFRNAALALKYQMNLEQGWGGAPSEYSYYGGFAFADGHDR